MFCQAAWRWGKDGKKPVTGRVRDAAGRSGVRACGGVLPGDIRRPEGWSGAAGSRCERAGPGCYDDPASTSVIPGCHWLADEGVGRHVASKGKLCLCPPAGWHRDL